MNRIIKILFVLCILLTPQVLFSQNRTWMSPSCVNNIYSTGLSIEGVDFYSNATIINFKYDNSYGKAGWVMLSKSCKIKAYPSGITYTLTSAEGIPYAPSKHYFSSEKEVLRFKCIFPAVPEGTTSIDWIEEDNWVIKSIKSNSNTSVSHSAGNRYGSSATTEKQDWYNPKYRTPEDNKSLELQQVSINSEQTILWFKYTNLYYSGGWCNLDRNAKIIAYPSNKTLYLQRKTDGIPYSPAKHEFKKHGEILLFNLFFPPLPAGTTSFDFIESNSSSWKMYNITSSTSSTTTHSNTRRDAMTKTVGRSVSTAYHTWTLKQIDFTADKTVCKWSVTPKTTDTYIYMTKGVYLIDNNGKKYNMISCNGISLEPEKDIVRGIRTIDYTVTFPAVDAGAKTITYYSSPTFQIRDVDISNNQSFAYGNNEQTDNSTNDYINFDINRSYSYNAYASSFCYPLTNGDWSEFGEWKKCNFEIKYDASKKQFVFCTARVQNYKVLDHKVTDPSITTFYCQDISNGNKCEIEIIRLPEDGGMQIYLSFTDERLCYAINEGASDYTSQLTTISETQTGERVLPSVINYPSYSKAYSNSGMILKKVTTNSAQTILDFEYTYSQNQDGGIWLSPKTCIKTYPSGQKFVVSRVEGIGNSSSSESANTRHYKGEKVSFKVYFPAVPANTTHFDFMEEGEMSDWVICGISNNNNYKKDFLMLNSTEGSQTINWEWYGGSKAFVVSTTASNYDVIGLPSWCKLSFKEDEGFKIECESGGEDYMTDYFLVKANGLETRVNISRKKFYEYTSPQAEFDNIEITHLSSTRKIMVVPKATIKNMSGRNCVTCVLLLDPSGNVANDVSKTVREFTPSSSSYNLYGNSVTVDYGELGISNLTGYTIGVALYDNDSGAYFAMSDKKSIVSKSRSNIASAIRGWGRCRLVAITESNGDVAINGGNGYTSDGLPSSMLNDLKEIRDMKEVVQDITLTERGEYVIIYGNNGIRCSNGIPNAMYEVLKDMNSKREKIISAVFNDNGEWIVISEEHYNASSDSIRDMMKEGAQTYGGIYSACLTNNSLIVVFERGYRSRGDIPSSLSDAIGKTRINVYKIKLAGKSWFFADKEGQYQMSL